jgi:hypothetical protein
LTVRVTKDLTQKLQLIIRDMAGKELVVGIPADKNSRRGAETNASIGYVNEFGSPIRNIPARPFLQTGVGDSVPKVTRSLRASAKNALSGEEPLAIGFNRAGLIAQSSVKRAITANTFTPLARSTLAARKSKGFAGETPLIETGQLLNSISYEIRDKSWR